MSFVNPAMVKTILFNDVFQNLLLSISKVMGVYPFSLKTKGTALFHLIIFSSLPGSLNLWLLLLIYSMA